jgi:hypothetical protein
MKTQIVALTLLLILLMAPLAQVVYAEDTGTDETGDETGEGEDGDEGGNGNIDPLVYEQIKQDTYEMYDQIFNLVPRGDRRRRRGRWLLRP